MTFCAPFCGGGTDELFRLIDIGADVHEQAGWLAARR